MNESEMNGPNAQGGGETGRSLQALQFDAGEYLQYVQDYDLSEEQAIELLAAIWLTVVSFVDLGFGVHPVQQACDVQEDETVLEPASIPVLSCPKKSKIQTKPDIASRRNGRKARRRDS